MRIRNANIHNCTYRDRLTQRIRPRTACFLWLFILESQHRCCNVLQCDELYICAVECCSVLQWIAVCCSVLQCVAVCCSVSQCVAVCCNVCIVIFPVIVQLGYSAQVLQSVVAACCNVLQCVAVCKVAVGSFLWLSILEPQHRCCNVLQCVAAQCSVMQCVAACCSVLQVCCGVLSSAIFQNGQSSIQNALMRVVACTIF